jgi:ABC-type transport system substrate-binding protein
MPPVTFLITSSDLSLRQAELARQMWIEELGCSEEQFIIEQVQFGTLLANTRREAGAARPDIWELGWASYYPDAHNWVGSLIHCEDSENRQNRPCTEVDDLIREAASTVDLEQRRALYRQVENLLFGDDGITPLIPLYVRGDYVLVQAWLDYRPALFGGEQYDTYVIDTVLKDLERSR